MRRLRTVTAAVLDMRIREISVPALRSSLCLVLVFVVNNVFSENVANIADTSTGRPHFTWGQRLRQPLQPPECCLDQLDANQRTPRDAHQRPAKSIPIDLARKLNAIESMDQFFVEFVDGNGHPAEGSRFVNGHPTVIRVGRLTDPRKIEPQVAVATIPELNAKNTRLVTTRSVNVSATADPLPEKKSSPTLIPKFAGCMPELRTVNLRDTDDPTLFYYPSCTRVDRCGGCCSHELLTCQPRARQYINYTVHVSKYVGKAKLEYRGTKIVTVEKHLKCNCECKVKPGDCTSQQKYEENDCRCVCTNKEDEQRCTQEEKTKLWNPSTCQCQCREVHECSSGLYFDESKCGCVKSQKTAIPPDYAFDQARYQFGGFGIPTA